MAEKKRSVINWTDEEFARLEAGAKRLGQSVPAFAKVAALEKTDKVKASD